MQLTSNQISDKTRIYKSESTVILPGFLKASDFWIEGDPEKAIQWPSSFASTKTRTHLLEIYFPSFISLILLKFSTYSEKQNGSIDWLSKFGLQH